MKDVAKENISAFLAGYRFALNQVEDRVEEFFQGLYQEIKLNFEAVEESPTEVVDEGQEPKA